MIFCGVRFLYNYSKTTPYDSSQKIAIELNEIPILILLTEWKYEDILGGEMLSK